MRRSRRTDDSARAPRLTLVAAVALAAVPACQSAPDDAGGVAVGVLLSYTGHLAADGINSERALLMAFEAANTGGGLGGHAVRVVARDTGSNPSNVMGPARELIDAGVALIIGPDSDDLVIAARSVLQDRTIILPSFATAADVLLRAPSWFVIGAPIARIACELMAQMHADGRQHPLVIFNPTGYSASLAWTLTNQYGLRKIVLPTNQVPRPADIALITAPAADAFVLAADPASAVSLVYALLAKSALTDPTRWYLSPRLHSPVFLDLIPKGGMAGARGVSQGTGADGADFRARFAGRWNDQALDDAYPFYDAGALAVLALQRALAREGAIPGGTGLSKDLIAVTRSGGTPVRWNELDRGLARLRLGEEITYVGLSGQLEFDTLGQTPGATTNWWTIGPDGFSDREKMSTCR